MRRTDSTGTDIFLVRLPPTIFSQIKPGKKTKRGQREPVFYYNSVTRESVRYRPSDYEHDPLHIPKKAMFGMHFYH
jgi:hypothetical protein